jgi:hypothetical protein
MRKEKIVGTLIILILIFAVFAPVGAVSAFAGSLSEYRQKIQTVREELDFLRGHDEETETAAEIRAEEKAVLTEIRKVLPPTETVKLSPTAAAGADFEIAHDWLLARLKAFEEEPQSAKRNAILNEVVERLAAIEYKLGELEKQEIAARSKDEDKQKLREILARPEYQKPEEQKENFLQKAWRDFWEWLGKVFPKAKPVEGGEAASARPLSLVLQLLLWGVALGLIAFLIYRFAPFLRARFLTREKTKEKRRVILGETLTENQTSGDLFGEAEKLAGEGNQRAAIRKGYIALLCELSDRKIIGLAENKTNRDYLRDLRRRRQSSSALYRNMTALTDSFERVWYGFRDAKEQDWESFKEKYQETVRDREIGN